jgi:hypothetical protein
MLEASWATFWNALWNLVLLAVLKATRACRCGCCHAFRVSWLTISKSSGVEWHWEFSLRCWALEFDSLPFWVNISLFLTFCWQPNSSFFFYFLFPKITDDSSLVIHLKYIATVALWSKTWVIFIIPLILDENILCICWVQCCIWGLGQVCLLCFDLW